MLVAPGAFKGTLAARAAARAIAAALPAGNRARLLPIADGGDGTAGVIARARDGRPERLWAADARGVRRPALAWRLDVGGALDLAAVCGLRRLAVRGLPAAPLDASTRGLGEALAALGSRTGGGPLYVGLGGSASTDGGAGLLAALGGRLLDRRGNPLPPGGAGLERLARIDLDDVPAGLTARLRPLVDVHSPLLGPAGASATFGPQKGATPADVSRLEAALARLAETAARDLGADPALARSPGAGAAGGTGYAMLLLGASLLPGADTVLDMLAFDAALAGADTLVTGEGGLDRTSLVGKAPVTALRRARAAGIPAVVVCGRAQPDARRAVEALGARVAEAAAGGGRAGPTDIGRAAARVLAAAPPTDAGRPR